MNLERHQRPAAREVLRRMGRQQQEEEEKEGLVVAPPPVKPEGLFGTRHVLGLMGFLGFANVYAMRVNLSVAVVAMVNSSAIPHVNTSTPEACPDTGQNSSSHHSTQDGEFAWDENEQALILGAFFWGYVITNPLGGRLGEVVGGKVVFCVGVLVTAVLTLLTPVVARTSTTLFIALRVIEGLGEGVTFPAMNSMLARWIPPFERSRASSFIYTGSQVGTVISMPISGLLCQSSFLGGWPSVFYLFGALGVLWCIAWMFLIHDDPEKHPRINLDELTYIQHSLNRSATSKVRPFPLVHVLTSLPFWAIVVAHVAQNWGFYTLLTEMPTYMKNILRFDIAHNSFMSALPYLVMWLFSMVVGQLADYLQTSGRLSTANTRRLFNSIGIYGPMVCLVLVGYAGCNRTIAITLLCLGVGLNGATFSGYINSHLDIAPNFAGTLMGLTNCAATVPGFVAPMVAGALINGKETVGQWKLVFWIAGIVYLVGNTFYIIFLSGEKQYWNDLPDSNNGTQSEGAYGTFLGTDEVDRGTQGSQSATSQPAKLPEIF
ncbi:putative inorganic phosphate cotransporter isoform X2 [Portunus trituberculatus]|uniref:putative inorganic phosphate cotransporter isoform X2 n=1 Tax=Portunus trituberculatus TaxID=210409 RepID=UPI001E1CE2F2|nr:putative inorganic phosphate cotransporter isoform X2 [Portunus trituberculatus]